MPKNTLVTFCSKHGNMFSSCEIGICHDVNDGILGEKCPNGVWLVAVIYVTLGKDFLTPPYVNYAYIFLLQLYSKGNMVRISKMLS